jgi:saccharopine dehydrogenase (NAD+, L-lysine-forming)
LVPRLAWKIQPAPLDAYILGLKELPENDDTPLGHTHIFFAHCYKAQEGWRDTVGRFVRGGGTILDLEFLNDDRGRRVAAFGYHAGFAGAAIGLDVWCQQRLAPEVELGEIKPFPNEDRLIAYTTQRLREAIAKTSGAPPKVLVMGALGRCGSGAVDFALHAGIPSENVIRWDLEETKGGGPFPKILECDIFVNCIYLNQPIPPFFTREMLLGPRVLSVICDVSCDTTNPHNPIPVYSVNTTFAKPTVPVAGVPPSNPLDVISIDHLPTLLPRESSEAFSRDLLPTLLTLKDVKSSRVWGDAERLFKAKAAEAQVVD